MQNHLPATEDHDQPLGENQTKQGSMKYGCNIQTESTGLYVVTQMVFSDAMDSFHHVFIQSY